ncbi:pyridoxal phosphate-dependent aminotransferase [Variovorax guangxiensis]|uniref:pyridoxal phosphate-dependent aminotransferase n=1 Tax=Variovorax guangxiensis TaxID=1775474 RepID=UPI00285A372E|nr:pyridoxal phosphate-dependent aminotransferase [Variovorax guangxiensis]MDR6855683.1 aspartate aminotransferase [Variovorax guangxiensis]
MTILAERLSSVKASPSMMAKSRVDGLRAAGRRIIDFTIGEPDFPTPAHIVAAGVEALHSGQTRYTASTGTPALRQAIALKLARENQLTFTPEQVVVGCGAKQIIHEALAASLNAGDEVIVPAPYWVSYPDMVAIQGGVPVVVPCGKASAFKLTAAALEAAITPRTRWVILNSPNNPSGAVYTEAELRALAEVLSRHPSVWLLTDEIYEHFVYGAAVHRSMLQVAPALAQRTLVVNGMSKSYAMTGWRIGFGAGPLPLMRAIALLLSQSTSCAAAMSQAAAVTALNGPQQCVAAAVADFSARRDRMVALLNAVPGIDCSDPDGAFYVFPDVSGLLGRQRADGRLLGNDLDVMLFLLEEAAVATIDGASYGMPGFLRMSFATSIEQIEQGCRNIREACASLR